MKDETKTVIEKKFNRFLAFKKDGTTSAEHAAELLREIGINNLTDDVLKSYLYNGFSTMCYDITAAIEARHQPRKDTLNFWKEFYNNNKQKIDDWINKAKTCSD